MSIEDSASEYAVGRATLAAELKAGGMDSAATFVVLAQRDAAVAASSLHRLKTTAGQPAVSAARQAQLEAEDVRSADIHTSMAVALASDMKSLGMEPFEIVKMLIKIGSGVAEDKEAWRRNEPTPPPTAAPVPISNQPAVVHEAASATPLMPRGLTIAYRVTLFAIFATWYATFMGVIEYVHNTDFDRAARAAIGSPSEPPQPILPTICIYSFIALFVVWNAVKVIRKRQRASGR